MTITRYFSGKREISSTRWLPKTEAAILFPGINCVRVDSFSVIAGWAPGHMHDAELLPVTRVIYYADRPSRHNCDARCRHARGRNCECSCGGQYHGLGD